MYKKLVLAISVAAALVSGKAIAEVKPTEIEYIKYESELSQFFTKSDFAKFSETYFSKSDQQRRFDGWYVCFVLDNDPGVRDYLKNEFSILRILNKKDPVNGMNKAIYKLGVTTAAVDTLCTHHRASLVNFYKNPDLDN